VWPWGFWLSSEDQRDLGFFRVFLSTRPMPSFFSMTQGSPFPVSNIMQRGGGKRDPRLLSRKGVAYAPKDECTAKMVTIIQTREKVKSRISPLNLFTVGNHSIFEITIESKVTSLVAELWRNKGEGNCKRRKKRRLGRGQSQVISKRTY